MLHPAQQHDPLNPPPRPPTLPAPPKGICQWTLGGGPDHPIYIDAVRRVINATRYIEDYISDIPRKVDELERKSPPGWRKKVKQLQASAESGTGILSV